ncbi:hypothetical protein ColTof4_04089 [Colletotrichum tofieldiae]|uniref:Uncharacterized protein n=1 Tax=Colletotrichum liriopes TaxID=708192 RepID=A0AA37LZS5_9PEZI|nr:hypothetical protein ColLi_13705 [Colletotrichum liriopes]GKT66598.1 hypothetical protein ColTof3_13937 [Colletotrichum tofieldiae]GKT71666.1 hypothetical protein ColTof4_04089 [Colletotrichum tofieldiae]GKT95167.1 hypothetical protein Ct61P_13017 [Colletotrichum tofieldiae]
MGSHHKSSGSKGHGSSSHGKSSGSKKTVVYIDVWYCDACNYGPLNHYTDAHCPNCRHQRCYGCRADKIKQRSDH